MPSKETSLGHLARKRINRFLQRFGVDQESRRLAYVLERNEGQEVLAVSGKCGIRLARELYDVDLRDELLRERFQGMILAHGYRQPFAYRAADVCAEAHLWMTLIGRSASYFQGGRTPRHFGPHPRHQSIWVYELNRKGSLKEDSPCDNCRQWVRLEFRRVNGTG